MRRSRRQAHKSAAASAEAPATLLFDGDCAFCSSVSRWGQKRFDVSFEPYQVADLDRYGVSESLCSESVVLVVGGQAYLAGEAIARTVARGSIGYQALASAMLAPAVRSLVELGYQFVARNRHRLPGGTPACRLDPPGTGGGGAR